jgi:hypothetical protein
MPIVLLGLAVAAIVYATQHKAHASPGAPGLQGLQPGAAAYLPPIMAPDWARVAYANAAASKNPITMAATAQQLIAGGQMDLAKALSTQYQALTNMPIPGVGGHSIAIGAALADPRMMRALTLLARARRARREQMLRSIIASRIARTA